MSYIDDVPCDKSLSWTSIDSYHDETIYWQNVENAFRCKALKKMCKTEFLLTPIIIENKECYSTKSKKFIVHLDPCHDTGAYQYLQHSGSDLVYVFLRRQQESECLTV